ncbi:MAG: Appr-1-p processing protein [Chloroflexi bacterium]|nr:Appr-1-p processing protein [Chloroflexota bacterium]
MIQFVKGDILKQDAEALINTVNCVGIMGRGIALQFRKAFPENFKAYEIACKHNEVKLGQMFVFETGGFYPRYIINFPTKQHWKSKSRIEDIQNGLKALVQEVEERKIKSIAIPPLGAGLGGLNWLEVKGEILKAFANQSHVEVFIFEPVGAPAAEKMVRSKTTPNMTIGRAALIGLMRRYLAAIMDPTVSLLEVQKLMYFMQESGEGLRLRYGKGPYGPYAPNLAHVLQAIEGHFISGYLDGGDDPRKPLELRRDVIEQAEEFLLVHQETLAHFNQVTELIEGFETPYGMELLSTVHWVATREGATTPENAVEKVHSWSERKKMFPDKHINIAFDVLYELRWVTPSDQLSL